MKEKSYQCLEETHQPHNLRTGKIFFQTTFYKTTSATKKQVSPKYHHTEIHNRINFTILKEEKKSFNNINYQLSKFLRRSLMIFIIKGFWTIVFIFIVISTTFWPICPPAFFRYLSNSGIFTELNYVLY